MAKRKSLVLKNDPLPDLPSELILTALADLEAVEKNPKYKIDMGEMHSPDTNTEVWDDEKSQYVPNKQKHCYVCFGGAVMAQSLKAPINRDLYFNAFGAAIGTKLDFLDACRGGLSRARDTIYLNNIAFEQRNSAIAEIQKANAKLSPMAQALMDDVSFDEDVDGRHLTYPMAEVTIPYYENNKRGFKAGMRKLAKEFAKIGL